jgi:peptidoglycan-associated lipoprotein
MIKLPMVALLAVLALAACNNPDRFGRGGVGDDSYAGGPGGIGVGGLGDPNDPNSPAYFAQRIGDRVLFQVDQFTLSPEARATLTAQAQWLNNNPTYTAVIEGHADEQGTREYNIALSARRANAAKEFLVAQGVLASRMRTIPYGKEKPLAVCSEESCYAQNRRAMTVLGVGAGV